MSYQDQLREQLVSYLDEQYRKTRELAGIIGTYEAILNSAIKVVKGESYLDAAYLEQQMASTKERADKALAISSS
jgi:hypothetical protein